MAVADPEADPVISKRIKRTAADYKTLVDLFGVDPEDLADYGLYADGKEYIIYESDSNLRDTEKIPVSDDIYEYFKREVKPYADDAWINLPQPKSAARFPLPNTSTSRSRCALSLKTRATS